MSHKFEHDGVEVEYFPAVVRTRLSRGRILQKLLTALNLSLADVPPTGTRTPDDDEFDNLFQYAAVLSQSKAEGAAWWASSDATPEQLAAAYECFLDSTGSLFDRLRAANRAVDPEKKMNGNTPTT